MKYVAVRSSAAAGVISSQASRELGYRSFFPPPPPHEKKITPINIPCRAPLENNVGNNLFTQCRRSSEYGNLLKPIDFFFFLFCSPSANRRRLATWYSVSLMEAERRGSVSRLLKVKFRVRQSDAWPRHLASPSNRPSVRPSALQKEQAMTAPPRFTHPAKLALRGSGHLGARAGFCLLIWASVSWSRCILHAFENGPRKRERLVCRTLGGVGREWSPPFAPHLHFSRIQQAIQYTHTHTHPRTVCLLCSF